jgi:hypothetical protein
VTVSTLRNAIIDRPMLSPKSGAEPDAPDERMTTVG